MIIRKMLKRKKMRMLAKNRAQKHVNHVYS